MTEPITHARLEQIGKRADDEIRQVLSELIEARTTIERERRRADRFEAVEREVRERLAALCRRYQPRPELAEFFQPPEFLESPALARSDDLVNHLEMLLIVLVVIADTGRAIANVRSELAPEHWPQALRDIKRGGDGEPDLDEPTLEREALALDMYRERLLELQAAPRVELTDEERAAATRGMFTAEWAGRYLAPHTLLRVADDPPIEPEDA